METGATRMGESTLRHQATTKGRRVTRALGATLLGLLGAVATTGAVGLATAGPSGADTAPYTLTCNGKGATWAGKLTTPLTLPAAVTTGSVPGSVTATQSFTLTGYGLKLTLPDSGIFGDAGGATISGTYTTTVTASGATPTPVATSFTVPTTTLPKPIPATGAPLSASGSPVNFTAGKASGPIAISAGTQGTLSLTVGLTVPVTLTCTNPASVIATTTEAALSTKVTNVSPNAGPLVGGVSTTITGQGFTGASAVTFGGIPATRFTVDSATAITAVAPPHPAGVVDVQVTSPDGTSAVTPADQFTYTNGPIVTGVSPDHGPKTGGTSVIISGLQLGGATAVAFGNQPATGFTVTSPTRITATAPAQPDGVVDVVVTNPTGSSITGTADQFTYGVPGYWEVASDGGVFAYGTTGFYGSMGGKPLNQPIVGMAATPDGGGYWEVARDGGIFAFGDAQFYGSMGGKPLNQPIVGMAVTPDGKGYWLVASDGGLFAFGDAPFYGSAGAVALPAPVVSLVAAPTGGGYWEIGATGAVYAFGTPGVYGTMGGRALSAPVVDGAATPDFYGNWLVGSDGGIFNFGNAAFYGSMGGKKLNQPIVAMAPSPGGTGYWEVASDGGVFSFGSAHFYGSMGGQPLNAPVVGVAVA